MNHRQRHLLFTPGPLTTRESVRRAMMVDLGSREEAFLEVVKAVRSGLLEVAGTKPGAGFEAVPVQGSGTFAIEAALGSLIPADARLLVPVNGAYGRRIALIAERLGIQTEIMENGETSPLDCRALQTRLAATPGITHIAAVHCETSTGMLNPVAEIGRLARDSGARFLVDAMSSFGGIPIELEASGIDALVSSANKCLEGVPGLAFAIVRRTVLEHSEGVARSVSLDLFDQWKTLEETGQFRFTPPTHVILALRQALSELATEGGVPARAGRYLGLQRRLVSGTRDLGLREVLPADLQSPIITAFHSPKDSRFSFPTFHRLLAERNLIIYPGKLADTPGFRIGTIGALDSGDIDRLLAGIRETLEELRVPLPLES